MIKKLSLVYLGDPILRKKATFIEKVDEELVLLIKEMDELMQKSRGVGLAAPQVGLSLRLFILRDEIEVEGEEDKYVSGPLQVFINPILSAPSEEHVAMNEGCLSIPGVRSDVLRPKQITVEALDIEGKPFKKTFEGLAARIVMHENDHINGVLFIDRLSKKEKDRLEPKLREVKKKFHP
jgi:peptide deformylase